MKILTGMLLLSFMAGLSLTPPSYAWDNRQVHYTTSFYIPYMGYASIRSNGTGRYNLGYAPYFYAPFPATPYRPPNYRSTTEAMMVGELKKQSYFAAKYQKYFLPENKTPEPLPQPDFKFEDHPELQDIPEIELKEKEELPLVKRTSY